MCLPGQRPRRRRRPGGCHISRAPQRPPSPACWARATCRRVRLARGTLLFGCTRLARRLPMVAPLANRRRCAQCTPCACAPPPAGPSTSAHCPRCRLGARAVRYAATRARPGVGAGGAAARRAAATEPARRVLWLGGAQLDSQGLSAGKAGAGVGAPGFWTLAGVGWSYASWEGARAAPLHPSLPTWALQVRDLVGGGAVVKRTLVKGQGDFPADCPLEDSRVAVHLRCAPRPRFALPCCLCFLAGGRFGPAWHVVLDTARLLAVHRLSRPCRRRTRRRRWPPLACAG
jgi:hypothetical protein